MGQPTLQSLKFQLLSLQTQKVSGVPTVPGKHPKKHNLKYFQWILYHQWTEAATQGRNPSCMDTYSKYLQWLDPVILTFSYQRCG